MNGLPQSPRLPDMLVSLHATYMVAVQVALLHPFLLAIFVASWLAM
jgi:hypothetical protein